MSSNKKNNGIAKRMKAFENKEKACNNYTPPTAPPVKVPKNTAVLSFNTGSLMETSPMAQRQSFNDSLASHMTVPEIVDLFNEQIEINEKVLAQEAEDKAARRQRYLQSRKKNRKNAKAKKVMLAKNESKQQEKELSSRRSKHQHNHYSLQTGGTGGGVLMNDTTSFVVDPKTYKAPKHLPRPTEPQTKLLMQALNDNVLFFSKEDNSSLPKSKNTSASSTDTTSTSSGTDGKGVLKEALVQAFETVVIKKGQTVQEALSESGSHHHYDKNCLYVIESGEMALQDETGKQVATATAG